MAGDGFGSVANGASSDGSTVVGSGRSAAGEAAFLWDPTNGMRALDGILTTLGLGPQLAGWTLAAATAISANGQMIVGYGMNPSGQTEAWLAMIPEPGTALLVTAGLLRLLASRRRRAS